MANGVSALQADPRRTRRWILGAGVAGLLGGWVAGAVRRGARSPEAPLGSATLDPDLVWARDLAAGALDQLILGAGSFLAICKQHGDDPRLEVGVHRLGVAVMREDVPDREEIRVLLLSSLERTNVSKSLAELRERLRSRR